MSYHIINKCVCVCAWLLLFQLFRATGKVTGRCLDQLAVFARSGSFLGELRSLWASGANANQLSSVLIRARRAIIGGCFLNDKIKSVINHCFVLSNTESLRL
jgi:hypothetical protein